MDAKLPDKLEPISFAFLKRTAELDQALLPLRKVLQQLKIVDPLIDIRERLQSLTLMWDKIFPLQIFRETSFDDLEIRMKEAIVELSFYGWYYGDLSSPGEISTAFAFVNQNRITELDSFMMEVVESELHHIEATLISRHPHRTGPIKQAFDAHQRGEYYLSIPVFFAQCDGISKDLSDVLFFMNEGKSDNYIPKVSIWASRNIKSRFHKVLCAALLDKGAFQKHYSQANKITITRHSVLHGESVDYGSKVNSLKAISLIIYISDVMSW